MSNLTTKGRYPWGPGAKFENNYVSEVAVDQDGVHVRLDDVDNPDFWLVLNIPPQHLALWYHQLEAEKRKWLLADDPAGDVVVGTGTIFTAPKE